MGHWWEHGEIWLGSGTGTAQALIPYIQNRLQVDTAGHLYLWLHSDILQVLFENGIVGFVSYGIMYFYALKYSLNRPYLFAAMVGYLVTAAANYPARMAFHAMCGVILIVFCFRGKDVGPTEDPFDKAIRAHNVDDVKGL